jgi:hypothetical protein
MAAGDYIPKYKMGYTLLSNLSNEKETNYIVISTYRGLGKFSQNFSAGNPLYDERDKDHVLYALYDPVGRFVSWRRENVLSLYCCNPTRGKKILLEPENLKKISSSLYPMTAKEVVLLTWTFMDYLSET